MSDTDKKLQLPVDLPKCGCFQYPEPTIVMGRCADVASASHSVVGAFVQLAKIEDICNDALPYFAEITLISMLTSIAKTRGPALEYGSVEIEWEVEALLKGIEARLLMRSRDLYQRSRDMGLTEDMVKAMRERRTMDQGDMS